MCAVVGWGVGGGGSRATGGKIPDIVTPADHPLRAVGAQMRSCTHTPKP